MEEWIKQRIERAKKIFPDKFSETQLEWIVEMLESAWSRGNDEGRNQAFELMSKWRGETK